MPRIPLHIRKFVGSEKMLFLPTLYRHGLRVGAIEFLIDTGSPVTLIGPREGLRFTYPLRELSTKIGVPMINLAGYKFKRHRLIGGVDLTLADSHGASFVINYDEFNLLTPTKFHDINNEQCKKIPSIIGVDFITKLDATLVYCPNRDVAYLDFP